MILLRDVRFAFAPDGFALHLPLLEVAGGEHVAIVGPSGSGKSTLLNLISGILRPRSGTVLVDGEELTRMPDRDLRAFRIRRLGFVFQNFALIDYLDVLDNILHPARLNPALALTTEVAERARGLAAATGIADKLRRFPSQLSQGEQQRVAIARTLLSRPRVVLADEATGNLDPATKLTILDLLFAQCRAAEATLVAVTHDHDLLPRFDRVIDMRELCAVPA
jgi:ABC-type lipoprotein export system ATPase subunit